MLFRSKLSQWLAYSLIEPLQWGGLEVSDLDGLTGLAEYRNGGLFLDTGVLEAKRPELLGETQAVDGEAITFLRRCTDCHGAVHGSYTDEHLRH